jgi:tRNA dimethylallyltransferase
MREEGQIEETHRRRQLPVVVGGTAYWMQNLLFPSRLVTPPANVTARAESPTDRSPELLQSLSTLPPALLNLFNTLPDPPPVAAIDPEGAFELHRLLSLLDPSVGLRWHWKDTRKVLRHLEIIKETGRRVSDVLQEQAQSVLEPRQVLFSWPLEAKVTPATAQSSDTER